MPIRSGQGTRYQLGAENQWLEEEQLSELIDPDYPLLAVTIWRESLRQINEVPEEVWRELRERLQGESARDLFHQAIVSYCDDFHAQIADLVEFEKTPPPVLARLRQEAEDSRSLLLRLTKHGLDLSQEAVKVPLSLDAAIAEFKQGRVASYVNGAILVEELARRIEPESFILEATAESPEQALLIGAVDGSTRGGILSFLGEEGDFNVGHAPMVAINTSVGQIDRRVRLGSRTVPVFMRLPEKPEDMQRQDNRHTVMAKLLYPDLSDSKYMHSVWNAMDLLETKVALRLQNRWYRPKPNIEVPPADVVLRDGTVSPQDRDFHHYAEMSSYGQIVRDLIQTNWEIARKCRDDSQVVAGVIKEAQLSVFAPVLNWFASKIASQKTGQLVSWPMQSMNLVPDQVILTLLLTAGRRKADPWARTCVVLRPFHAVTNYGLFYSQEITPSERILADYKRAKTAPPEELDQEKRWFWEAYFRPQSDPYVKMLDNVFYANFFLGAVPRSGTGEKLPRFEFVAPAPTKEEGEDPWPNVQPLLSRLIGAVRQNGFEVSDEHSMFKSELRIDVLPSLLIRVHETVKLWAADLLNRVQEYVGYQLSRAVNNRKFRGVKVRPFTKSELELLYSQLKQERELQAGFPNPSKKMLDE